MLEDLLGRDKFRDGCRVRRHIFYFFVFVYVCEVMNLLFCFSITEIPESLPLPECKDCRLLESIG